MIFRALGLWQSFMRYLRGYRFRKRRHGADCFAHRVPPEVQFARAAYDAKRRAKRASSGELRKLQKMRELGLRAEVARRVTG